MKLCKRCVLPENFPHIAFDEKGVCNICRSYKGKKDIRRLKREYQRRCERLIRSVAGKNEYDLLMCYSGGKDSTYALKLFKKKYGLNILAFTFDNGFVPDRTYKNIRNVVEALDVDHIFFKPRFEILKKIFKVALEKPLYPAKTLERASTVCTSCMGLVKYSSVRFAVEKHIPLIGFGWSPGQAPVTSSILQIDPLMMKSMAGILERPLFKIAGKEIERYFPGERHYSEPRRFPIFVHPLEFNNYNEKYILRDIHKLGWKKPPEVDLNATNCLLNALADEAHIKKHCFHPYALEIAALVREGYMTRQEGLRHLPFKKNSAVLKMVKKRLGL